MCAAGRRDCLVLRARARGGRCWQVHGRPCRGPAVTASGRQAPGRAAVGREQALDGGQFTVTDEFLPDINHGPPLLVSVTVSNLSCVRGRGEAVLCVRWSGRRWRSGT
eukprot:3705121-Prymnesium_polylepis.1